MIGTNFGRLTLRLHNFEPNIGINCLSNRSIYLTAAIIYDRNVYGEDESALNCYIQITKILFEKGIYPARLNVQSMDILPRPDDSYNNLISKLKHALDEKGILAPGRYDFEGDQNQ